MQKEAILLVLAAGMGSRYGGLKQIDPLGPHGEILMDYSLYDAKRAGFKRVCFIIKEENREAFDQVIGERIAQHFEVSYAYQSLQDLPAGYKLDPERSKPLGTAHAVWAARSIIDAPFCVLNADDYYGPTAFKLVYDYLMHEVQPKEYAMISYILDKTLSDHGHVARGVCAFNADGYLEEIVERTKIKRLVHGAAYTEDDGATWVQVDPESPVSMNFWGFHEDLMQLIDARFPRFLQEQLPKNPLKAEYLLPTLIGDLVRDGEVRVRKIESRDQWFGVTYREDRDYVVEALRRKIEEGLYPEKLWA